MVSRYFNTRLPGEKIGSSNMSTAQLCLDQQRPTKQCLTIVHSNSPGNAQPSYCRSIWAALALAQRQRMWTRVASTAEAQMNHEHPTPQHPAVRLSLTEHLQRLPSVPHRSLHKIVHDYLPNHSSITAAGSSRRRLIALPTTGRRPGSPLRDLAGASKNARTTSVWPHALRR